MICFLVPRNDASTVEDYVTSLGEGFRGVARILCYEDATEQEDFDPGLYVFTGLDRLGPGATRFFGDLRDALDGEPGFRFLNHPTRTLRRLELLLELHREGLNDFRAFGVWQDLSDLRYPAFVRHRSQDGGPLRLLPSLRHVEIEIGKLLVNGAKLSEILVVEFLDTSDSLGFFRKFSAYFIDSKILPSLMDRGSHWVMRRHSSEFTRESLEEERLFQEVNPHEHMLRKACELSKVGFGRVDYSIKNGKVQIWEINTLPLQRVPPGAAPVPEELQPFRQDGFFKFKERFSRAFGEIHDALGPGAAKRFEADPDVLLLCRRELSGQAPVTYPGSVRFGTLRALLRPFKSILRPVAVRIAYPRLARSAMAAERRRLGENP